MSHNFYLLLDLDLSASDTDVIDAVIQKKQAEWSKLANHPTKGPEYKRNLELIPQIREVMLDPQARAKEAMEARQLKREVEKEAFRLLDQSIEILSVNGEIQEQEFEQLCQRFGNIAPENIRRRITVPIVKGKPKHQREGLDKSLKQTIDAALKVLGKQTLYEFLELSPTSSLDTLKKRAQDLYQHFSQHATKTVEVTAALELTGHCQNIFKTDVMRTLYSRSLAQERLGEFNEALDLAGMDQNISAKEYDFLLKKALEFGFQRPEAEEYILEYAQRKKWALQRPVESQADNLRRCGACGVTTLATARNCSNCGHDLHIPCPQCRQKNFSDVSNCASCGFNMGDMPNALPLLEAGKQALQKGDRTSALGYFEQAEKYWPHHPELERNLASLRMEHQALEEYPEQIRQSLAKNYYYKAQQLLAEIKRVAPQHPDLRLSHQIEQAVQAADQWLIRARHAQTDSDRRYAYEKALKISADCPVALSEMRKLTHQGPSIILKRPVTVADQSLKKQKSRSFLASFWGKSQKNAEKDPPLESKPVEVAPLLSDVLVIGPVASGKTTLTASLQFAAMQSRDLAYQVMPKNSAMIQLFQNFADTIHSGQIPINATTGEITEYQFQLTNGQATTPFCLLDGPGGAIFDEQHHFREEMLWNMRISEGLLFCLDITDPDNIRRLFATLPTLFPQVLNYQGNERLKFKRIAIVLTKVDRYIAKKIESGEISATDALNFAENIDPEQLVRETIMDMNLHLLFQYMSPDATLACGIASVFGFLPRTGRINFNAATGGLSSFSDGDTPQQVLANWFPFRVLEPFAFLATGELGHMSILRSQK